MNTITKQAIAGVIHQSILNNGRARTAWEGANLAADVTWKLIQPVLSEMHQKIGELTAANDRLSNEPCRCYEHDPDCSTPDVTIKVQASTERPKPPARGGW